jgi:hypothetical protein
MGTSFTVQIAKECLVCKQPIDRNVNKRMRSYCSKQCRDRRNSQKVIASGYSQRYLEKRANERASVARDGTLQCTVCSRWYKRVARHVNQRHGLTAKEYKSENGYALGRGVITEDKREHLRNIVQETGVIKNLKPNAYRFKKGDPRTRTKSNPWGANGAPKFN